MLHGLLADGSTGSLMYHGDVNRIITGTHKAWCDAGISRLRLVGEQISMEQVAASFEDLFGNTFFLISIIHCLQQFVSSETYI